MKLWVWIRGLGVCIGFDMGVYSEGTLGNVFAYWTHLDDDSGPESENWELGTRKQK